MRIRTFFILCAISLCFMMSCGQSKWKLTETMTAQLGSLKNVVLGFDEDFNPILGEYVYLSISTSKDAEAMPDYSQDNPPPWYSVREKITHIFLSDSVTSIGNFAFLNCTNLEDVDINLATSIGNGAFQGCTALQFVSVGWQNPLPVSGELFSSVDLSNVLLRVPEGTASRYKKAEIWKDFGEFREIRKLREDEYIADVKEDDFVGRILKSDFVVGIFYSVFFPIASYLGKTAMIALILILSVILFVWRIGRESEKEKQRQGATWLERHTFQFFTLKKNNPRRGAGYVISNILFLGLCTLEMIYLASTGGSSSEALWFCQPSEVGWVWTVINFLLFGGVLINQFLCLFDTIGDAFANGNVTCSLKIGIVSWIIAFFCALLCSFFYKDGLNYVLYSLCFMQLVQSIRIFIRYGKNILGALWAVFIYLFGSITTAILFIAYFSLLIIVLLIVFVAGFLLQSGSSSKSSSSSSSDHTVSGEVCSSCMFYRGPGICNTRRSNDNWVNDNTSACGYWRRR